MASTSSSSSSPAPQQQLVACIDTETTGLSTRTGRVVQVAVVVADVGAAGLKILEEWMVLVRPDGYVIKNSEFHGVTQERALRDGLPLSEVLLELRRLVQEKHGLTMVHAYNARFDQGMLDAEAERMGLGPEALPGVDWSCALKRVREAQPEHKGEKGAYKLQRVWQRMVPGARLEDVNWHDALADSRALAQLLHALEHERVQEVQEEEEKEEEEEVGVADVTRTDAQEAEQELEQNYHAFT